MAMPLSLTCNAGRRSKLIQRWRARREAYDDRPVVGGKVIVQVKRYSSTVPPTVVRDLFGTVHATGATKGVLVTTSGYGPESIEFVQGKPLELINGIQLEALLRQYELRPPPSTGEAIPTAADLQLRRTAMCMSDRELIE